MLKNSKALPGMKAGHLRTGWVPGNNITLFPDFGKKVPPPSMLHEAIHNAGGCDDINKGNSYPPSSSEDNAYSYEYFALDVTAGYKTPELGSANRRCRKSKIELRFP